MPFAEQQAHDSWLAGIQASKQEAKSLVYACSTLSLGQSVLKHRSLRMQLEVNHTPCIGSQSTRHPLPLPPPPPPPPPPGFPPVCVQSNSISVLLQVGSEVARRARGLGMICIAHDPFASEAKAAAIGVRLVGLDEALAQGDFFSLHMPLTSQTKVRLGP